MIRRAGIDSIRLGFCIDQGTEAVSPSVDARPTERTLFEQLQQMIADSLDDRPVMVEFSGGCDSSLVLSAATRACRSVGHADPVPIIYSFGGSDDSDDEACQRVMLDYLGLRERQHIRLDDSDLVSPAALEFVKEHGVIWPSTLAVRDQLWAQLPGGLLLSGEGGDEVLGPRRISSLVLAARSARFRTWRGEYFASAATSVMPRVIRKTRAARDYIDAGAADWLEPGLRRRLLDRLAEMDVSEQLNPRHFPTTYLSRPWLRDGHHNFGEVARLRGLTWVAPLAEPTFIDAVANQIPWHRHTHRHHLLQWYFADALPDQIRRRTTKATFNGAYFGAHTRAFAAEWDGSNSPAGVLPAALRANWRSALPHGGTGMLLQLQALASAHGTTQIAGITTE